MITKADIVRAGAAVRRRATIMQGDRHEFLQAGGSWGGCGGPGFCRECNRAADAFQCDECPMADPGECLKASHCRHRDGPLAYTSPAPADGEDGFAREHIRQSIIRQLGDDPNADRIILPGTDWDIVLAALSLTPSPQFPDRTTLIRTIFRNTGCESSAAERTADAILAMEPLEPSPNGESPALSREAIMAARTPAGGWTKKTLAGWGISWPPEKGWIERLTGETPPDPNTLLAALRLAKGHIDHMAAWIGSHQAGYSFEALGEDMPTIKAALESLPAVNGS